MISSAAHAATSYYILAWSSVAAIVVALITSAVAARTFHSRAEHATHGSAPTTLPELFRERFSHHDHAIASYDQHDRAS
jgi:hypothetical protein